MKIDHELFRTGIPLIDRQHEAYLELVERVFRLCAQKQIDRDALASELDRTLAYAIEHFDTEEHLMRSVAYPQYPEHRAKHNVFRDQVDDFTAQAREEDDLAEFAARMARWLVDWFCQQVQIDDRKLAAFLKSTPA